MIFSSYLANVQESCLILSFVWWNLLSILSTHSQTQRNLSLLIKLYFVTMQNASHFYKSRAPAISQERHGTTTLHIWCNMHSGKRAHTSNLAATKVTSYCPAMKLLTQWNITHMSEQIPYLKLKLCSVQQQFKHLQRIVFCISNHLVTNLLAPFVPFPCWKKSKLEIWCSHSGALLKIRIFYSIMPHQLANIYWHLMGSQCLQLQGQTIKDGCSRGTLLGLLTHGNEETTFLKMLVNIYQSTVYHPRRPEPWKANRLLNQLWGILCKGEV